MAEGRRPDGQPKCRVWPKGSLLCGSNVTRVRIDGRVGQLGTVVSARLTGQFEPIFWGKPSHGAQFFFVKATKKIKQFWIHKKVIGGAKY